jgi:hypothetical protein
MQGKKKDEKTNLLRPSVAGKMGGLEFATTEQHYSLEEPDLKFARHCRAVLTALLPFLLVVLPLGIPLSNRMNSCF